MSLKLDDYSLVGLQIERTIVAYFANEVKRLTCRISWDANMDEVLSCIVDHEFRCPNLWLLPPKELECMTIRIFRL